MDAPFNTVLAGFTFAQKRQALLKRCGEDRPQAKRYRGVNPFYAVAGKVTDGEAQLLSAKWLNYKAQASSLDIYGEPILGKESTYAECFETRLDFFTLIATLTILEGDHDGFPHANGPNMRCQWQVQLTEEQVEKEFSSSLDRLLFSFIEDDQEEAEARRKAAEMRDIFERTYIGNEPFIENED